MRSLTRVVICRDFMQIPVITLNPQKQNSIHFGALECNDTEPVCYRTDNPKNVKQVGRIN